MASGLFYIAEIVEEYTVLTKKIIRYSIWAILVIHVLLLVFEDFPVTNILAGIVAHGIYYSLLANFPYVEFTDPRVILSIISVIGSHSLWFYYFMKNYTEFGEIVGFFVVCVWLIPFAYFLSVSGNDSTLPYGIVSSSGEVTADDFTYPLGGSRKRGKRSSTFLTLLAWIKKKSEGIMPAFSHSQKLF